MTTRCFLTPVAAACMVLAMGRADAQSADPVKEALDKSPRHHEWIDVESKDGRKVRCFVVFPEVSGKAAAVLVIHENKGLTDWVRLVADRIAEKGYVAIAPDLLSGTGPGGGNTDSYASVDAATQGIYKLNDEQVTADLDAAAGYVTKLDASSGKLACMGFCWGGLARRWCSTARRRMMPCSKRSRRRCTASTAGTIAALPASSRRSK
jgi:carboxymethylenebutenolidase